MTDRGMSALYLTRSTVVVNGDGSSARRSDLVRLKRKVRLRLVSTSSAGERFFIKLPAVRLLRSGSRWWLAVVADSGWPSSSARPESVRCCCCLTEVMVSSSERPTKSLKPESFWPELSVPTLDKVDCDLAGSAVSNSFNFIGSSWTALMLCPTTVALPPPLVALPPSET